MVLEKILKSLWFGGDGDGDGDGGAFLSLAGGRGQTASGRLIAAARDMQDRAPVAAQCPVGPFRQP
jgi:hypothetical protein